MATAPTRSAAETYVDAEHHRAYEALKASNRRAERGELNHQLDRIYSIGQNRDVIDARYVARMQTIQNKKANMAQIIQRQHNSIGGRLARLTPGGRARQAATWQRLEERAAALELRAGRKHQVQLEQHHGHVQAARITAARDMKGLRGQNLDYRVDHQKNHIEHRPNKIHARMREMEQAKLMQLRPELKHQFQRQANKPPSQTVQDGPKKQQAAILKRGFNQQAQQPPSQTVQRTR